MTLCLLWEDFHDATKEGDGDRLMMLLKFMLIVFDAGNRYNYRKEAFILLLQCHYFFSPHKTEQLVYGRFINTHGHIGCNISSDLSRAFKQTIKEDFTKFAVKNSSNYSQFQLSWHQHHPL